MGGLNVLREPTLFRLKAEKVAGVEKMVMRIRLKILSKLIVVFGRNCDAIPNPGLCPQWRSDQVGGWWVMGMDPNSLSGKDVPPPAGKGHDGLLAFRTPPGAWVQSIMFTEFEKIKIVWFAAQWNSEDI